MTHRPIFAGLILSAGLAVASASLPAAAASTANSDIKTCQTALMAQSAGKYENAQYDFKSMRGSSLRKMKFHIKLDNERAGVVTCKIKRGEVVAIDWPETTR